jgi:GPH family glycoside/pentoside/hexuronide:cation symporter/probable glucitol transport protein GutA
LTEKRYLEILQDMKKRAGRIKEKPAMKVSS